MSNMQKKPIISDDFIDIDNYIGYRVSYKGEILSLRKQIPKILKPLKIDRESRYLRVALYKNGVPRKFLIHRLVAEAFIPNFNNLKEVNHIDNNPKNNHADNLEWVTPKQNVLYSFLTNKNRNTSHCGKHNGHKNGEFNHRAKLTQSQANAIREEYSKNYTSLNNLAKKYNVSKKCILLITQNKTYKNETTI